MDRRDEREKLLDVITLVREDGFWEVTEGNRYCYFRSLQVCSDLRWEFQDVFDRWSTEIPRKRLV